MNKRVFFHGGVPDSAGEIIAGGAQTRVIDAATVTNYSNSSVTLTIWQVPSEGSRADTNLMLAALSIADGATVTLAPLVNHAIAQHASIHAQASAASALTLLISGRAQ